MVLVTANKIKQLLVFAFAGHVQADQIVESTKDAAALMTTLEPGFRVLADLTSLDSMTVDCAPEIAKVMDLCASGGVKLIVRVIPDPAKDVGFSILSRFHYPNKPHAIVCKTLSEAGEHLGMS
jgi:hypothetical protein